MWPLAGGVLVLGGVLPSALLWLLGAADGDLWHTAAGYNAVDGIFSISAITLLWIAVGYGNTRGGRKGSKQQQPAPYPGAWVEADGQQVVPQGFPSYLTLAFVTTIIVPTLALAACLAAGSAEVKALAAATLAPYLLVFLPQILLETKYLNRSFMTPVLPVLYAYYRFWQFIRSLALVAAHGDSAGGQHSWLLYYLLSLMCFWAFDTGCTLVWLPGMYEWQLQDAALLARLSKQREQEGKRQTRQQLKLQQQQGGAGGHEAAEGPLSGPAIAAKLRHRWGLAGSHRPTDSGEYDSYSFGT